MPSDPSLSVVLSTRNHVEFLPGCLEGILTQTWNDFEFLIADDGSTDATWDFLVEKAKTEPRVRLFRNEHPLGVINSYNQLFRLSKGAYIWSVATDDHCINRDFLKDGFTLLQRFPYAAGFYAAMRVVKMPGNVFIRNWTAGKRDTFLKPSEIMDLFWTDSGYPCGPSLVLKKTWYEKFDGWFLELGPQCDCFLNVLAGGQSGMGYIANPSVVHRMWPDGSSFLSSHKINSLLTCIARMEGYLRQNLSAQFNKSRQWEIWRVDTILRTLNTKHEYRALLKRERKSTYFDWFSTIRALYNGVRLYCSTFFLFYSCSANKTPSTIFEQIKYTRKIWVKVKKDFKYRALIRFIHYIESF